MAEKKKKTSGSKSEPATMGGVKGRIVRNPDGSAHFVPNNTPKSPASFTDERYNKRDPKGIPYD